MSRLAHYYPEAEDMHCRRFSIITCTIIQMLNLLSRPMSACGAVEASLWWSNRTEDFTGSVRSRHIPPVDSCDDEGALVASCKRIHYRKMPYVP